MAVLLRSEVDRLPVKLPHIQMTAEHLLKIVNLTDNELSILIVSDSRIAELNTAYRHKEGPTNVLSFPMRDEDEDDLQGPALLGDIVISIDTAVREAAEKDISIDSYLEILLVHGLTHLLGYDHEQGRKDAEKMAAFEMDLLEKVNSNHTNPLTI